MTPTARLLLLFPLLSFVVSACSMDLPSQRKAHEFPREGGPPLRCYEPPPDVIVKGGKANAELTVAKLGNLLRASGGVGLDIERIRQELPSEVATFEVVDFRMCVQYGNGVLSKQEYQAFTEQIAPAYRKNPPVKPVASAHLVETCGPSFSTKRPAVRFVPYWSSVVEQLRTQRNVQYHDVENLLQVRGRVPVEMGMLNQYEEIDFVLECLERIGYLKLEKYDPPRMLEGKVENQRIVFSNPAMPVPQ